MDKRPLAVLLVEDNEDDAFLLIDRFRRAGFDVFAERVQEAEAMRAALARREWDVVLSDYRLPGFSGDAALRLFREEGRDEPFFIISGTIDDATASAAMRAGAQDFLSKDRLDRLVPAVERELREARVRRERAAAIEAAHRHEGRLAALAANIPGMVFQLERSPEGAIRLDYVSEGAQLLFSVPPSELQTDPGRLLSMILTDDRSGFLEALTACSQGLATLNWEGRIQIPSGDIKWINVRGTPTVTETGAVRWEGVMWNITYSKETQLELSASREQLAELSNHLQRVKEDERERIARDIHDVLGGLLIAIKIEVSLLAGKLGTEAGSHGERAQRIAAMVDDAIGTTGRVARELRPGILKEFGLAAAIEGHAEDFTQRTGVSCEVLCADHDIEPPEDTAIAIFRVFQEALTNVSKHAQAQHVEVRLMQEDDEIVLQLRDDGIGIRSGDFAKPRSFGLRGMRERIASLGGSIQIHTQEPRGTELLLRAPMQPPATQSPEFAHPARHTEAN